MVPLIITVDVAPVIVSFLVVISVFMVVPAYNEIVVVVIVFVVVIVVVIILITYNRFRN